MNSVARFCRVSHPTVDYWRNRLGMPGDEKNWDMAEIIPWLCAQRKITHVEEPPKKRGRPKNPTGDELETEQEVESKGSLEYLERGRKTKWQLLEMDLAERRGQTVQVSDVRKGLAAMAMIIRESGEKFEKCGEQAIEYHAEMCDQMQEAIPELFKS